MLIWVFMAAARGHATTSPDGKYLARTDRMAEGTQRCRFFHLPNEEQLVWREVVALWATDSAFQDFYVGSLAASPFDAFYWECPATSQHHLGAPFEHVTVRSRGFRTADPSSFDDHLNGADGTATFKNLGGDSTLVAPCENGARENYGHIANFMRHAAVGEKRAMVAAIGNAMRRTLDERGTQPTWLSTEGSGVPWLHVRLDSRPKYYHTEAYTAAPEKAEL
jgi:hypothetical protein